MSPSTKIASLVASYILLFMYCVRCKNRCLIKNEVTSQLCFWNKIIHFYALFPCNDIKWHLINIKKLLQQFAHQLIQLDAN